MCAWDALPESEKGYLAGIFDGEGYVCICKSKRNGRTKGNIRYTLQMGVSMCDSQAVEMFKFTFDGSVHLRIEKTIKGRTEYRWIATTQIADYALRSLLPYLKIKKERAKIALEFHKNQHTFQMGKKLTDEELQLREYYYQKLNSLNFRSDKYVRLGCD